MYNYLDILNDKEILDIYDNIEKQINYVISHDILHVKNVIRHATNIADVVSLDDDKIRLLLIAATLHDVGRNFSNHDHNIVGLDFIKHYLANKLSSKEIDIICDAIYFHDMKSANFNKMDDIAYCLILADKLDYESSRLIPELIDDNPRLNLFKNTKQISVSIKNNNIIISFEILNKDIKQDIDKFALDLNTIMTNFIKHFNFSTWKYETKLIN